MATRKRGTKATTRTRTASRPAARRATRAATVTKATRAAKAAKPPGKRWATGLVSLKIVAKRADADPKFFKALAANPNAIAAALAPFRMQLSELDAGRLGEALARVDALTVELEEFLISAGGWGPWPNVPIKHRHDHMHAESPEARTPGTYKGVLDES